SPSWTQTSSTLPDTAALTFTIVFGLILPDAEMVERRFLRSIVLRSTSVTSFSSCAFLAWKPMPPATTTRTPSQIFVRFFKTIPRPPRPPGLLDPRTGSGAPDLRERHGDYALSPVRFIFRRASGETGAGVSAPPRPRARRRARRSRRASRG